jgi:hypothetical protein
VREAVGVKEGTGVGVEVGRGVGVKVGLGVGVKVGLGTEVELGDAVTVGIGVAGRQATRRSAAQIPDKRAGRADCRHLKSAVDRFGFIIRGWRFGGR